MMLETRSRLFSSNCNRPGFPGSQALPAEPQPDEEAEPPVGQSQAEPGIEGAKNMLQTEAD